MTEKSDEELLKSYELKLKDGLPIQFVIEQRINALAVLSKYFDDPDELLKYYNSVRLEQLMLPS